MGKTQNKKKRSPAMRRVSWILGTIYRVTMSFIMVCVITGCICGCALVVYLLDYIGTLEDIDITNIDANYTSILYANDESGNPYELSRLHGQENRILVDFVDMPQELIDVVVAAEDKRFWEHNGVDWQRTAAATLGFFLPGLDDRFSGGGSSITQQLIKNATGEWDVSVERKIKEIFSAIKLQNTYTREQILEAYLNIAAFGHNTNGIEAAANYYFNKSTKDLSLVECATIVAITKAPTAYDPIENPEANKERRRYIFDTMLEMGTLTQEEHDRAVRQDVTIQLSQVPAQQPNSSNTWFEDYVIEEVIADLMDEHGMTYTDAQALLFRGGLKIFTTVDQDMQERLEEMYIYSDSEDSIFPQLSNAIYPESAFVILDHHGQIKALAGSNRPKKGNRVHSYATDEPRQPGSTIKPISAYLQGIERNFITWSTVVEDSPIQLPGTSFETDGYQPWPVNYYGGYDGDQTCVMALQRSINTIPVKILNMIGWTDSMYFLQDRLGISSIVTPEENPESNDNALSPMALGALTRGATVLEMAAAYQIFANSGTYTEPTSYTIVQDNEGNTLLEAETVPTRVISKETSSILNLMMQQVVVGSRGTGTAARFSGDLAGMPIAGKTGTSQDNYDQWFIGVTPYYIGATWMGYAPKRQSINYSPHPFPTPILWKNVMEQFHEGLEVKDFEYSSNIVQMTYCAESGDLASDDCPNRLVGWYKTDYPPDVCTEHTNVKESEETDDKDDINRRRNNDDDEDDDESSSGRRVVGRARRLS